MADSDERLARAQERIDMAEGFMTDAEFREEHDSRVIRYFQAMCNAMLAVYAQNEVIIDLLGKQQDVDMRGGRR